MNQGAVPLASNRTMVHPPHFGGHPSKKFPALPDFTELAPQFMSIETMAEALLETRLTFAVPFTKYAGKVRDTYHVGELMVLVASDRISAFDVVLPRGIPFKGQVLNQTAAYFLEATRDIAPNHLVSIPDPNVTIGLHCRPIPIEMVVRGYLCGHAWRVYAAGGRMLCGVQLPEGLRENDPFPAPIITPSTKSTIGHDEDISEREILKSGLVDGQTWEEMKYYALALFQRGQAMAREKGLLLADTKYEFGYQEGDKVTLIDEIHTPDSSRYFYSEGFDERQSQGKEQRQLSKEFVRKWLIENGFQGKEGQQVPPMTDRFVEEVSERYIHVHETITGNPFQRADTTTIADRIERNVMEELRRLGL
jgi:phosphoribosylaminoimidazole-succinocarboxamide synthase